MDKLSVKEGANRGFGIWDSERKGWHTNPNFTESEAKRLLSAEIHWQFLNKPLKA